MATQIQLEEGFGIYGGTYEDPTFEYSTDGVTVVQGLVSTTLVTTEGAVIGRLPSSVGVRPSNGTLLFQVNSHNGGMRVDINTSGEIIAKGEMGDWISLSGIVFDTHSNG